MACSSSGIKRLMLRVSLPVCMRVATRNAGSIERDGERTGKHIGSVVTLEFDDGEIVDAKLLHLLGGRGTSSPFLSI